jgi:hypothetical protein
MSSQWYYKPGDYYQLDDLSGFKIRASRSRKIPGGQTGGLIVAPERWEPQHPQDFVRGVVDDQTVPQARPRQKNQFVITATYVTAFSPRLTAWMTVDSIEGFSIGDRVSVMLDGGEPYYPTIVQLLGNQMRITPLLPQSVGGPYADPIENVIVDLGPSGHLFLTDDAGVPITDDEGNLFETTA